EGRVERAFGGGAAAKIGGAGVAEWAAAIQAATAVLVVRLPRRVGGLYDDVGLAIVVAHDEDHVARAACVVARQPRDVNAGHGAGRRPRRGDAPAAAVDESGRFSRGAPRSLVLRVAERPERCDLACADAAVIPETIDVYAVAGRVGLYLEVDRLSRVDADIGREPLNGRIARPDD